MLRVNSRFTSLRPFFHYHWISNGLYFPPNVRRDNKGILQGGNVNDGDVKGVQGIDISILIVDADNGCDCMTCSQEEQD